MLRKNSLLIAAFILLSHFLQCKPGILNFSIQSLLGQNINSSTAEFALAHYEFYPVLKAQLPLILEEWLKKDLINKPSSSTTLTALKPSFHADCFNCIEQQKRSESAKLDIAIFTLDFLKNECIDRIKTYALFLRIIRLFLNNPLHDQQGYPIKEKCEARKFSLSLRNDAFINLIAVFDLASQSLLKIEENLKLNDEKDQALKALMNLFRICNFFYKIQTVITKNNNALIFTTKKVIDTTAKTTLLHDNPYSATNRFDEKIIEKINTLLATRLEEKTELILHKQKTSRINQSFFSKVCDEITEVAKLSFINQLNLSEKIFELLTDAFEGRVNKFIHNIENVNEFLRKQMEKTSTNNVHCWPCNCPEEICKSGQRDFNEYLSLLDIINDTLIDIMKIFDSPKLLIINKCVRMFEYQEWFSLINSIQNFTNDRLIGYSDAINECLF
ncbi:hypothetical protein FJ364_01270 [Candidatus Dependentiae bacterium]|nr:hypothetical protein [Candidatus Dependentiae bacterium]